MWLGLKNTTVYSQFVFAQSTVTDSAYLEMLDPFWNRIYSRMALNTQKHCFLSTRWGSSSFCIRCENISQLMIPNRWIDGGSLWNDHHVHMIYYSLIFFCLGFIKSQCTKSKKRFIGSEESYSRSMCRNFRLYAYVFQAAFKY